MQLRRKPIGYGELDVLVHYLSGEEIPVRQQPTAKEP
jgi:hypothetical protein